MTIFPTNLRYLRRAARNSAALGAVIAAASFAPETAFAFAGIPDAGGCTDFINNPQDFVRHRQADITYRISNNFRRVTRTISRNISCAMSWNSGKFMSAA